MKSAMYVPESAVLEITNRCNLHCPHCASNSGRRRPDEMDTPQLIAVIRTLADMGCRRLTLLGGELLLHPEWFKLAAEVKSRGILLQIITNGIAITEDVHRKFCELAPEVVAISMDGASRESYIATRGLDKFDFCLKQLWKIRDNGIPAAVITTFSRQNLHDFDRFVELLVDRGVIWQIQTANNMGERFPDDWRLDDADFAFFVDSAIRVKRELAERLPLQLTDDFGYFPYERWLPEFDCWNGCPAGRRVIGIRSNGDVLPCLSLGDGFVAGNLLRTPLEKLWADAPLFRRFRNKAAELTGRCRQCSQAERCQGGCTASALTSTGEFGDNRYCIRRMEEEQLVRMFAPQQPERLKNEKTE